VTKVVGRSELNIRRCSSLEVLDFVPKNVSKSCTVWVDAQVVGSAGGDSRLLTLDHSAWASRLDSEIAAGMTTLQLAA